MCVPRGDGGDATRTRGASDLGRQFPASRLAEARHRGAGTQVARVQLAALAVPVAHQARRAHAPGRLGDGLVREPRQHLQVVDGAEQFLLPLQRAQRRRSRSEPQAPRRTRPRSAASSSRCGRGAAVPARTSPRPPRSPRAARRPAVRIRSRKDRPPGRVGHGLRRDQRREAVHPAPQARRHVAVERVEHLIAPRRRAACSSQRRTTAPWCTSSGCAVTWSARCPSATSSSRTGPSTRVMVRMLCSARATTPSPDRARRTPGALRAAAATPLSPGARPSRRPRERPGRCSCSATSRRSSRAAREVDRLMVGWRRLRGFAPKSYHAPRSHRHRYQLGPHDRRPGQAGPVLRDHRPGEGHGAPRGRRARRPASDRGGHGRRPAGAVEVQAAGRLARRGRDHRRAPPARRARPRTAATSSTPSRSRRASARRSSRAPRRPA